jgi:hypothetical protein
LARRPAPFKQHYVTRAVRGAIAAGIQIERIEIDRAGTIILVPAGDKPKTYDDELDEELAEFEARHRQD